jgi:hypothetical protein
VNAGLPGRVFFLLLCLSATKQPTFGEQKVEKVFDFN